MKKLAFLALIASPAYSHQITPQSEFFREELKRDPLTVQVLNWCNLVGITDESVCKAEMYNASGTISSEKITAAKICVEKSGLERRAALDKFFKVDPKEQGLVGHQVKNSIWHNWFVVDPAEGKDAKPHMHYYTEADLQAAGEEWGAVKAREFKDGKTLDTSSAGSSTSGTGTLGASGVVVSGQASVTHGKENSATKGTYTQKELDEVVKNGTEVGRRQPELTSVVPHGFCEENGNCFEAGKGKVAENGVPPKEAAKSPNPKSEVESVKEAIKDFFAPIIEGFTGGPKPADSASTEKPDVEKTAAKVARVKGVETPVHDPDFISKLNGCVSEVENILVQETGSKTTDPDAPTEAERKAAAEQELSEGYCDTGYWGWDYCNTWQLKLDSNPASTEEEKQDIYDQALAEFYRSGWCDRAILGNDFCAAAEYALATTPVEDEMKTGDEQGSDENPPNTVPNHISTDGAPKNGNPSPNNPKKEN